MKRLKGIDIGYYLINVVPIITFILFLVTQESFLFRISIGMMIIVIHLTVMGRNYSKGDRKSKEDEEDRVEEKYKDKRDKDD